MKEGGRQGAAGVSLLSRRKAFWRGVKNDHHIYKRKEGKGSDRRKEEKWQ